MVLADNGSTDGAPEKAAAARDHVTLLHTGGNLGYGTAANRGVADAADEYGWIVVANPDLECRRRLAGRRCWRRRTAGPAAAPSAR